MSGNLVVRKAMLEDLKKCLKIDGALKTDRIFKLSKLKENDRYHIRLDVEDLKDAMELPFQHHPERLDESFKDGEIIVADDNGKIVGYSEVRLAKWNRSCWVINIVIDSAYRRQGLGSQIMERIKLSAKEFGMRTVMFNAAMSNYPAYKFYLKNGFRLCGLNDRYYPDNAPALFLCFNME
jgi:ribosomal protein S18 acetylase RimI-like enzyme